MTKQRYEKLKALHKCVDCGDQDETTLAGHTRCDNCAEKHRQYCRKIRKKLKVKTSNFSILGIVRLASAEGLSYGKYIARHRDDNML